MKLTIKTIKQIINEELKKVLYEEDNNDVLRKALSKTITDEEVKKYDKIIKQKAQQMFNELLKDPKILADPELVEFIKNENYDIKQRIEIILSLGHDLSKYQSTLEEIEPYPLEGGLKDKKPYVADGMIKTKDISRRKEGGHTDLKYAKLRGADLSGLNLNNVSFGYANLREANLRGAILYGASFRGANLSGADLSASNLRYANLSASNLSGANLSDADLLDVNLWEAVYNDQTVWPKGFKPKKTGAIKK